MSFLDESEAVVADTLSFIDAFEAEHAASIADTTQSTASSPSPAREPGTSVPAAPAKKTSVNRSRHRQKQELEYLRVKVVELRAQLAEFNRSASATPKDDADAGEDDAGADASSVATTWKAIAERQQEARLRAQVENVKLREMLEAQIRMANMLERVLRKRTPPLEMTPSVYGDRYKRLCPDESVRNDVTINFDALVGSLDGIYASVDQVFAENGLAANTKPFRNSEARDASDTDGMFIEFMECKVVPFDHRATTAAIWRYIQHEFAQSRSAFHGGAEETEDTITMHIGVELEEMRMQGRFQGKYAVRRYLEEDRTVYVWRMVITPVHFSAGPTRGLLLHHKGWMVVKKPAEDMDNVKSTAIQVCVQIHPVLEDDHDSGVPSTVGVLTEFVIHSIDGTANMSNQMMENFLLEEAVRRRA